MEKLSPSQLEKIYHHLLAASPSNALQEELLDHLACEVEEMIGRGQPFEKAMSEVFVEANTQAVRFLKQSYQTELGLTGALLQEANLTELVFEHRNKAYGAYPLRQAYPSNVLNALLVGTGIFLMLLGGLISLAYYD